jgi:type VII secretion-associated serine protease mycosin
MTAEGSKSGMRVRRQGMRRRLFSVLAGAGALTVSLTGLAPAAVAEDVRDQQWYLDGMQMDKVWEKSTGKGVKVAVVDTGVDDSSPTLQGRLLPGKDTAEAPGGANNDDVGHGTTVAEMIAGTGKGGGLRGLAPDAEIIPIRAALKGVKGLDDKYGKTRLDSTSEAIRAAVDSDAQIINMSWGDSNSDGPSSEVVKYAAQKGKLLFAATGNDGEKQHGISYPAAYPEVVAVGAVDRQNQVSKFSSWADNDDVDGVDLVAAGEDIPARCDGDFKRYCEHKQGTSYASALASASAALIWSKHPDWTANQVLRVMIDTAGRDSKSKNPSKYIGWGLVRPRINLLESQGDPGDARENPLTKQKTGPAKSPLDAGSSDSENGDASDNASVADSSKSGDDSQLLTIIGAGAGAVIVLGGAFAFMRMRRN